MQSSIKEVYIGNVLSTLIYMNLVPVSKINAEYPAVEASQFTEYGLYLA